MSIIQVISKNTRASAVSGLMFLLIYGTIHAQTQADDTYKAFNDAFLVRSGSETYYKSSTTKPTILRSWGQCLEIAVVEDVYERTYDPVDKDLVIDLLNNALLPKNDGLVWTKWDGWNDDIAWMGIAFMRGYQITGKHAYLTAAETNWNKTYNRGWDTTCGGGGIWECMDNLRPGGRPSKCALSNDPMITIGCALYEATGDATYLTKCQDIYAWVRANLFNTTTGQVNEGLSFPGYDTSTEGKLQPSDNVYNSGSFIEAANALYRMTGDKMYYKDALLAINHIVIEGPILHNRDETDNNQWAYRFIRGLSQFCNDNNYWNELIPHSGVTTYYTWLLSNANAAWSMRDSLNLTWNDWTQVTDDVHPNSPNGVECSSAVSIWQLLPPEPPITPK